MQSSLFDDDTRQTLSIEACAKTLAVSEATVRNWIKTGYLTLSNKGHVSHASVMQFKREILGKEKLYQRANKSQKDSHNHLLISADFLARAQSSEPANEALGKDYEDSLSDSYKNQEGIYYTPEHIVNDLFNLSDTSVKHKTFCDPCCGSGNFLLRALDLGFKPENLFGFDIDPVAVAIAKKRIFDHTGFVSNQIICADFLHLATTQETGHYDYIFTNPPWGKKIAKSEKDRLSRLLQAGNSLDTCALFYFACLHALNTHGVLGLLLPDAFFNVSAYADARASALSYQITRLCDYAKAFKGLQTNAVGLVLTKQENDAARQIDCLYENVHFQRTSDSLRHNPKYIFNLSCNNDEAALITHLYRIPHLTLEGYARWGLGIVTGNNTKYLRDKPEQGYVSVYKGSDITPRVLKTATNFLGTDFSQYQQVAPLHLYQAAEKLIYKFISSRLCFFYDTEARFIINSANLLITDDKFPISMSLLADLLNSELLNWLFKKLFNTHKVLRSDLERLPIHAQFLTDGHFIEADYLNALNIEKTEHGTFRIKK
ncbi:TaqI-like C-terminal specificity domain-containing protein [Agitococcus lubricus]|uniref:site-specific DNA-methyltransferase (adenine-specific) n=1 Tax=Agitococcus lubricus TaxID=1077255 RepID=A0A2T5J1V8_9GAMM|nr:TaqI-like C-terminal specificity domain-containing protein [Agitococcus lubricus]PTQ90333.1 site-specific DNA-methyltransferase (adenine-specific) [Agitococcus lubricus]